MLQLRSWCMNSEKQHFISWIRQEGKRSEGRAGGRETEVEEIGTKQEIREGVAEMVACF